MLKLLIAHGLCVLLSGGKRTAFTRHKLVLLIGDHSSAVYSLARALNRSTQSWRARWFPGTLFGIVRFLLTSLRADAILWGGDDEPPSILYEIARLRGIPAIMLWSSRTLEKLSSLPQVLDALKAQPLSHAASLPEVAEALRSIGFAPLLLPALDDGVAIANLLDVVLPAAIRKDEGAKRVAISGFDIFASTIARYTDDLLPEWEPHLLRFGSKIDRITSVLVMARSHVWYSVGGPPNERWLAPVARLLRKPRVVHWVGTDVELVERGVESLAGCFAPRMHHVAETSWMAEPLNKLGLKTQLANIPPRYVGREVPPFPERFTVMIYVPRTRSEFYGREASENLLRELAGLDIRYLIVGGGTLAAPAGVDVTDLGWQHSLAPLYPMTTVLIRLHNKRDGLSVMVLEALSFGRYVIWTQPFPHVLQPPAFSDVANIVRDLYESYHAAELAPQYEAAEMVARDYSIEPATRRLGRLWSAALAR